MNDVYNELKLKFWTQFIPTQLAGYENIYAKKNATTKNGIGQKIRFPGASIYVNLNRDNVNVTLVIHSNFQNKEKTKEENEAESTEENIRIFNYLEQNSYEIQKHFNDKVVWEKKPNMIRRVARITNNEWRYEKQSDWDEMIDYLIKTSYLLKISTEEVLRNYHG